MLVIKNGEDEVVLSSPAAYERLELYRLLDEAEMDACGGDRGSPVDTVRRRLKRARLRADTSQHVKRQNECSPG